MANKTANLIEAAVAGKTDAKQIRISREDYDNAGFMYQDGFDRTKSIMLFAREGEADIPVIVDETLSAGEVDVR